MGDRAHLSRDADALRPAVFDAEAFVDDLLAAGCRVSVHQPVAPDARPACLWVAPAGIDGTPTAGERQVRAQWAGAMAACPDIDQRVLAVCRHRVEEARARLTEAEV